MKILGVHDGHIATAAMLVDGEIQACISEERLNRKKEWNGIPRQAIAKVLEITGTSTDEIEKVAFTCQLTPLTRDQISLTKFSARPFIFGIMNRILPKSAMRKDWWVDFSLKYLKRKKSRIFSYFKDLGISKDKLTFVNHHLAHAYTLFLNWWQQNENMLILTLDGSGDGLSGTVNVCRSPFDVENVERINTYNSIGTFYSRLTEYLGMKPLSHEYKVMGMAGYGNEKYFMPVYKKMLDKYFTLEGLKFKNLSGCWGKDYLNRFAKDFKKTRFDNFCAGAQKLIEELIVKWVKHAISETGIKNVFCSGGVFMNVKVNKKILTEIDEIEKFFVFPSCGDESTCIGAAIYAYKECCEKRGKTFSVMPIKSIYWGQQYSNEEIEVLLKNRKYGYIENINEYIGKKLAEGKVIARCSGRAEWGARALGNRSILARADDPRVVRKINKMIKFRDFWMPFAATILAERADEYLVNNKGMKSPYMIMSFDITKKAKEDLIAGLHMYDFTCRPQILESDWNHDYYRILKSFERETGFGGILNTSLNLHEDPIVNSPKDALYTFDNSELDMLVMNNYVITRESEDK